MPDHAAVRGIGVTRQRAALLALFAGAFAARLGLVLASPGGLTGNLGDDAAAYYTGADALLHGRLPYRDFTLLHPPLLLLVLLPFAAFGAVFGDALGFQLATLANHAAGAACACLVVVVARRWGLGRWGAWTAGLFYAVWFGAALTDMLIRLETLASVLTVLALWALARAAPRSDLLAGALLGLAAVAKIWGLLPALVVTVWLLAADRDVRRAARVAGAAAGAFVLVLAPFWLAAPGPTWRMVFTDQLGRARNRNPRLPQLTTLNVFEPHLTGPALTTLSWLMAAVFVAVIAAGATWRPARMIVALTVVETALLLSTPSFFQHYLGLLAVPLSLTVGSAVHAAAAWRVPVRAPVAAAVGLVLAVSALATGFAMTRPGGSGPRPFPTAQVRRLIEGTRCPTPDGPVALILTDQLSRTLAQGCPNWVDVTGRVYGVDRAPQGPRYPRVRNVRWQRDLGRYLFSGDVVITFRPGAAPGPALRRRLARLPLLLSRDGVTVRCATPRGCRGELRSGH